MSFFSAYRKSIEWHPMLKMNFWQKGCNVKQSLYTQYNLQSCFEQFFFMSCLQVVLNNATVETDNPDLRDRAYIYWRLLSTDPEVWFCQNEL